MPTYAIENRKGGVGKTTTTCTLGVGLASRLSANGGGNVLIIDMDAQGHVAASFDLETNGRCVSDVLLGDGGMGVLQDSIIKADKSGEGGPSRPNLYVLPSSDRLSDAKLEIMTQMSADITKMMMSGKVSYNPLEQLVGIFDQKLGVLKQHFKFILIDCAPTLDVFQQAIHKFADSAIVPVKLDFLGTMATSQHTDNILTDQAAGIDITIAAIVPTFVDGRIKKLTAAMVGELVNTYGRKAIAEPIPQSVRVSEAPFNGGRTIIETMPDHDASLAYFSLIEKVYEGA